MCKWMSMNSERVHLWGGNHGLLYVVPHGTNSSLPKENVSFCREMPNTSTEDMRDSTEVDVDGLQPLSYQVAESAYSKIPLPEPATCQTPGFPADTLRPELLTSQPPKNKQEALLHLCTLAASSHWTAVIVVGLGTGLTALGVNLAAENMAGIRFLAVLGSASDSQFNMGIPMDHLNLALLLIAATLCAAIAVAAGSSGLGDLGKGVWPMDLLQSSPSLAAVINALWRSCQLSCRMLLARHLALSAMTLLSTSKRSARTTAAAVPEASSRRASLFEQLSDKDNQEEEECSRAPLYREPQTASDQSGCSASVSGRQAVDAASVIMERELAMLMWRLESPGGDHTDASWEAIVEKQSSSVKYVVKRRDPQDGGATEYLSTTQFANCSPEMLRNFYMDSEYLRQWDPMVRSYERVGCCHLTGVETGHFVKKYPLCSPREYLLAWRVWQKNAEVFYCITKAVDHPNVPRQQKLRRVDAYTSMWRISSVPGTNSAEVLVYIQEDNGMQREFAKMAFRRGIWSYIRKTDEHLRRYAALYPRPSVGPTALSLAAEVPEDLDPQGPTAGKLGMGGRRGSSLASLLGISSRTNSSTDLSGHHHQPKNSSSNYLAALSLNAAARGGLGQSINRKSEERLKNRLLKQLFSSLVMVGGAVVLTHGAAPLGVKVAAACLLPSMMKPQKPALF